MTPRTPAGGRPVPLSLDLELRPSGTAPVSLGRMLAPSVERFVTEAVDSIQALQKSADEAHERGDYRAEIAVSAQISNLALRLLRLSLTISPVPDHVGTEAASLPVTVQRKEPT